MRKTLHRTKAYGLALILLLGGCSNPIAKTWEPTVLLACESEQEKAGLQDFMLECLGRANPKSDEEPEDWMPLCEKMGHKAICKTPVDAARKLIGGEKDWRYPPVECRLAVEAGAKAVCARGAK